MTTPDERSQMVHCEDIQYDPVRLPGYDFVKTQTEESWNSDEWTFHSGRYAHYLVSERRPLDLYTFIYGERRQKVALSYQFEVQPDHVKPDNLLGVAVGIASEQKTRAVRSDKELQDFEPILIPFSSLSSSIGIKYRDDISHGPGNICVRSV
jgi:hypothetical protein